MKALSLTFDIFASIVGVIVMMGTLFAHWEPRFWLGCLGFLIFEISIWKLIMECSPYERKYNSLRSAVGEFLSLVCQLNAVALAIKQEDSKVNRNEFDFIIEKMRQKVEQIAQVPGKTDEELEPNVELEPDDGLTQPA